MGRICLLDPPAPWFPSFSTPSSDFYTSQSCSWESNGNHQLERTPLWCSNHPSSRQPCAGPIAWSHDTLTHLQINARNLRRSCREKESWHGSLQTTVRCLTGLLTFLPIHASFPTSEPAIGMIDITVSSYTPTISPLLQAQERNKPCTFQMLVVGQPNAPNMRPLPCVQEEVQIISRLLSPLKPKFQALEDSDATVQSVASSFPGCSWAHFACHGIQDADNPMDSGFVMSNGERLTLSWIAQSSLASPQFAFLSSWQSATGSKQFPNEAVHRCRLAICRVLQRYWDNVVCGRWGCTFSVATDVYKELFKDGTVLASASEVALALHQQSLFTVTWSLLAKAGRRKSAHGASSAGVLVNTTTRACFGNDS